MIAIDGSAGEGGGQILRTSLALSAVTGQPFAITGIRAGRAKPGLLRQHLAGVRAAAAIASAQVVGDALGATSLTFVPGARVAGEHRFAVGSAGSANLVLQTVLMPLVLADRPSRLVLSGGTHNPAAPPHGFLDRAFLPILARMGARVRLDLVRWGFYPAGGGEMIATIEPAGALTQPVLDERGPVREIRVRAVLAGGLSTAIGDREVAVICAALGVPRAEARVDHVGGPGPGNAVWAEVICEHATELFTGFGERGVRAEDVAQGVADEALAWLAADVPVGEHLADQLLLPMALAGGGSFRTVAPTQHTRTNAEVIAQFLPIRIAISEERDAWRIVVRS